MFLFLSFGVQSVLQEILQSSPEFVSRCTMELSLRDGLPAFPPGITPTAAINALSFTKS